MHKTKVRFLVLTKFVCQVIADVWLDAQYVYVFCFYEFILHSNKLVVEHWADYGPDIQT